MPKHICFLLDFYPTADNEACIFAKNLIYAIAEKGIQCTVISPQPITPDSLRKKYPYHREEFTDKGQKIDIYMPYYVYATSKKVAIKISMNNHYHAVLRTLQKNHIQPDVMYGHFFFQCGLTASRVGKKLHIPSYCACGENSTRLFKDSQPYATGLRYANWKSIIQDLTGIISVSSYNKQLLIENGFASEEQKIGTFPNAIDPKRFHPMDRTEARKTLGLPQDVFAVVFNGAYTERKGFKVICEALEQCENVYSIFIGSDAIKPTCKNVLFSGRLAPENVPQYLAAANVFVLPTLGEGCCNAIVEALACGLPVISSNLPFNDDILDDECSIRVEPKDAVQIADAIKLLENDEKKRVLMAEKALKKAEILQLDRRAAMILEFMGINND